MHYPIATTKMNRTIALQAATPTKLQSTIQTVLFYRNALSASHNLNGLKNLLSGMQIWVGTSDTLKLHLQSNLTDLQSNLAGLEAGSTDLIDVQISRSDLLENLRVCAQVFAIQLELVKGIEAAQIERRPTTAASV